MTKPEQTLTDLLISKIPIAKEYKSELLEAEKRFTTRAKQLHTPRNVEDVVSECLLQYLIQRRNGTSKPHGQTIICHACEHPVTCALCWPDSVISFHKCEIPQLWEQLTDDLAPLIIDYENEDIEQAKKQMRENIPVIEKRKAAKMKMLQRKYFAEGLEEIKA